MISVIRSRPEDDASRSFKELAVYDLLDSLSVPYDRADHEAAATMEDCLAIDRALGVTMCKNLFLTNRQQTAFYLLLMPGDKPFKTKDLSAQINSARLSFGSPELMEKMLGVLPGSATVFGLMNDNEKQVRLLIDADILKEEYIGCHPCVNTSSVKLKTSDLIQKVLPAIQYDYTVVHL